MKKKPSKFTSFHTQKRHLMFKIIFKIKKSKITYGRQTVRLVILGMFFLRMIEIIIECFCGFFHFNTEWTESQNARRARILVCQLPTSVFSPIFQLSVKEESKVSQSALKKTTTSLHNHRSTENLVRCKNWCKTKYDEKQCKFFFKKRE